MIQHYPETRLVFLQFGFTRSISIEQACRLKHVDSVEFLERLRTSGRTAESPNVLVQIANGTGG